MKKIVITIGSLIILTFYAEAQTPTVTSITPNSVANNATQPIISISGTNFGTETGLVGNWHLNGNLSDSSGNNNNGTGSINYGTASLDKG